MGCFHRRALCIVIASSMLSSCATLNEAGKTHGTAIGCTTGALLGALATYAITGDKKTAVGGAVVGGAVGCVVGNQWQKRLQALDKIAKEENLQMEVETLKTSPTNNQTSQQDAGLVAQVENQEMFASGSDQLTTEGARKLRKLAQVFIPDAGSTQRILVIGHTDATGSAEFNQALSERRAHAMGQILTEAGIDPKTVFFQGAGASRPIAENTSAEGRAKNRRVELVSLESEELLHQRIRLEQANPRYLTHSTRNDSTPKIPVVIAKPSNNTQTKTSSAPPRKTTPSTPPTFIDFAGKISTPGDWNIAAQMKPKTSGFTLFNSAYADTSIGSCAADQPRISGKPKNMLTGKEVADYKTTEYLPGMNGRVWANLVNGHLLTITPISVLKDDAEVTQQPIVQIVKDYNQGKRATTASLKAIANTYEGQDNILYRVFIQEVSAPVSCMDVLLDKSHGIALDGKLFYEQQNDNYVADFVPKRT